MSTSTFSVGLDVHKDSVTIAVFRNPSTSPDAASRRTRSLTCVPVPSILPSSAPDRAPPTRGKGSIPTCCGLKRGAVHLLSA